MNTDQENAIPESMNTVQGTIKDLLQWDSSGVALDVCPTWPPDLFAIAATLLKRSGCYAHCSSGHDDREKYRSEVSKLGSNWAKDGYVGENSDIDKYWKKLVACNKPLIALDNEKNGWQDASFRHFRRGF